PALDFNVDHYVDLNSDGEYYHETIELLLGGTTSELLGTGVLYDMIEDVFDRAFDGKTIETIILENIQNSFTDAYGTIYIDNVEYSKDKTTLDFIEEFGVATDIREAKAITDYLKSMPTEDLNSYGVLSQIKKLNKIVDRVKQNHSYLITSQSITQTEQALDLVVKDSLDQLFYVLSGDNTSFRVNAPKDMVPYILEALNTI